MSNNNPIKSNTCFNNTLATTRGWFQAWLDCFSPDDSGIWKHNNVELPYYRKKTSIFGITMCAAFAATNSHTPRYDIVGGINNNNLSLTKLLDDLSVSYIELPGLSGNSDILQHLASIAKNGLYSVDTIDYAPYVETTGSWDDYWQSLGSSRRELGRRERKFFEKESSRFVCLTNWEDISPIYDEILKIEASGWKGKQGSSIIQNPDAYKFYKTMAENWANEGYLRLFLLYDDTTPVAFEINAEYNGILHCFKHGYLESYAKQGVGQVLRTRILRQAFDNPKIEIFDMFGPETPAKNKWATHSEELFVLRIFKKSPFGILAWFRYHIAPRIKRKFLNN